MVRVSARVVVCEVATSSMCAEGQTARAAVGQREGRGRREREGWADRMSGLSAALQKTGSTGTSWTRASLLYLYFMHSAPSLGWGIAVRAEKGRCREREEEQVTDSSSLCVDRDGMVTVTG